MHYQLMNNVIALDTNVDVLDLGTAAVPPDFWPTVRRFAVRTERREAVRDALIRTMGWANSK